MKFINKTKWDTRQLRKLCSEVIKKLGANRMAAQTIIIEYKTRRYSKYHGVASIGGTWLKMFVPRLENKQVVANSDGKYREEKVKTIFNVQTFAKIMEHEIEHNLGLRHEDMVDIEDKDVSYINGFSVEQKLEKPKEKINLKEMRFEKAKKKVKLLESKKKRIDNLLKKWQKKVRYYERI